MRFLAARFVGICAVAILLSLVATLASFAILLFLYLLPPLLLFAFCFAAYLAAAPREARWPALRRSHLTLSSLAYGGVHCGWVGTHRYLTVVHRLADRVRGAPPEDARHKKDDDDDAAAAAEAAAPVVLSAELRALRDMIAAQTTRQKMTLQRFRAMCDGYHIMFFYRKALHRDVVEVCGQSPPRLLSCHYMRTCAEPFGAQRMLLFLHGGGFIAGSAGAYRGMLEPVARAMRCNVFAVDYRKMPEHPLPAAVDDALLAYSFLRRDKGVRAEDIVVAGDSAGGSLCLLLLHAIKKHDEEANGAGELGQPAGAMLMSPYVDLSASTESWTRNRGKCFILHAAVVDAAKDMLKTQAAHNLALDAAWARRFSPVLLPKEELAGLAPLFVSYSTAEPLCDEIETFVKTAREAEVELEVVVKDGCPHTYQMYARRTFPGFSFSFHIVHTHTHFHIGFTRIVPKEERQWSLVSTSRAGVSASKVLSRCETGTALADTVTGSEQGEEKRGRE